MVKKQQATGSKTKLVATEPIPSIDEEMKLEKEQEGSIIRTWGTGTGKRTMSLHIRKSYYTNLGWDIGDFLYMEPNFQKGEIVIKKVDTDKLKRKR